MEFWRQLPRQIVKAIFSRSLFSWVWRSYAQNQANGDRLTMFRLAIAELSLFWTVLMVAWIGLLFESYPVLAAPLIAFLGEGEGAFLLADNTLRGVLFGLFLGFVSVLLLRRLWLPLVFAHYLISSGATALHVGWGFWLGLLPGFWLLQVIRAQPSSFRRWLAWKTMISSAVFVVVVIFSHPLSRLLRIHDESWTVLEERKWQWLFSGAVSLFLGLVLAGLFFHIYFWLFGRKR